MKTLTGVRWIIPWFAGLCLLTLVLAPPAGAGKPPPSTTTPKFALEDLGNIGVTCINDYGTIGGASAYSSDHFIHPIVIYPEDADGDGSPDDWYQDGDGNGVNDLMVDLGFLGGSETEMEGYANGLNEAGDLVGSSTVDDLQEDGTPKRHGVLWTDEDGDGTLEAVDLGVLLPGQGSGSAVAVNESRWITGMSGNYGFLVVPKLTTSGYVWFEDLNPKDGANDLMVNLGYLMWPYDIDDDGRVILTAEGTNPNKFVAYLLTPVDGDSDGTPDTWVQDDDGDGVNDLLSALPTLAYGTAAYSFHESGRIAGWSRDRRYLQHAVYWTPAQKLVDLGKPHNSGLYDHATDLTVDASGVVHLVGYEADPANQGSGGGAGPNRARYWDGVGSYYLYDCLKSQTGIAGLESAGGINSSRVVIGNLNRSDGTSGAYVAVPATK